MGEFREAEDTDDLGRALQERACPTCRRALQPWETTCPDDGTPTIPRPELPPLEDELVAGLGLNPDLFDGLDDDGAPGAEDGSVDGAPPTEPGPATAEAPPTDDGPRWPGRDD